MFPKVNVLDAWPLAAVVVLVALNDWPVALPGTVAIANVTLVPLTGFPLASVTVTTNGLASDANPSPLWLLPEVNINVAAAPAMTVKAAVLTMKALPLSDNVPWEI